jgi:enamine deaminase RidA (YjgF/YER057c/UK114 family)
MSPSDKTGMTKRFISSGSTFERLAGYSRAVLENGLVHVSGTTGFDYQTMTISDDVVEQTEQAFRNVVAALNEAGATLDDVVRVHYLITDAAYFEQLAPIFGRHFDRARPAATAMVVGLIDARMKIEIEVTARLPQL